MTQVVLYQAEQGIVLATDSQAVRFSAEGERSTLQVQKLFLLGRHTLLAAAGAGYGLPLCVDFRNHLGAAEERSLEEVSELAQSFFTGAIEKMRASRALAAFAAELDRVYFILAGYRESDWRQPFQFFVLASEGAGDPVHLMPTPHFCCIPRQLSMEYRLHKLDPQEITLEEVEVLCDRFLRQLAENSDDVGPPFHVARITRLGIDLHFL